MFIIQFGHRYRRAQLALGKGDEDLAREALKRRKSYAVNAFLHGRNSFLFIKKSCNLFKLLVEFKSNILYMLVFVCKRA